MFELLQSPDEPLVHVGDRGFSGKALPVGRQISELVERHPSIKVLALSFLLMVGVVLLAEGFGGHVPKGYIYGAMGFSVFVEIINIRSTRKTRALNLDQVPHVRDIPEPPPSSK